VSLVGFKASNHPQQVTRKGADDEIDDRGTPQEFWDELNAKYRFTLDVAAAPHNAKTANYYTRLADGLLQPWHGSVWCNPPYSGLDRWLEKAWTEWNRTEPATEPGWSNFPVARIVMLLPANRPEQPWWQEHVEPFRDRPRSPLTVEFLPGRLRFIKPGATEVKPNERPPFGCCLLVWSRPGSNP
jgi:phage N-6-adenine-methyltransferase